MSICLVSVFVVVEEFLGVGLRAQKYNKDVILYAYKILRLWPLQYVASFKNINIPKMATFWWFMKSHFQNGQEFSD